MLLYGVDYIQRMASMLQRLTSIFIALLLTVFLLAFPAGGYTTIHRFKYVLFLIICGGYVLGVVIVHAVNVVKGKQTINMTCFKKLPVAVWFLLGFLCFTVLSAILSPYPGTFIGASRREGLLSITIYVLCCVFVSLYLRPQKWMLFLLGIVTALTCVLGLVQLTGRNPFGLYPGGHNFYGAGVYYGGSFLSTVGNSGLYAGFLVLAVGVLTMALIKFEFETRWWLAISLFIGVLLIFRMHTDAAYMGMVGVVLIIPVAVTGPKTLANTLVVYAIIAGAFILSRVIVFQDGPIQFARLSTIHILIISAAGLMAFIAEAVTKFEFFEKIDAKWYRVGAFAVIITGCCAAFIFLWTYSGEPSGMIYEASQVLRGNWHDNFGNHRVYIWREILERIRWRTLLLGTGPDTMIHWDIPPFVRETEFFTIVSHIDNAHNELLHIFAMGGLLSLLAYLGALGVALINWVRQPKNALAAIAGAGVLFYFIQSLFAISHFSAAPFFWVCFGVLIYSLNAAPHFTAAFCHK